MSYRKVILSLFLIVSASAAGFPQASPKPAAPSATPSTPEQEPPPPPLSVPKEYHYNPAARHDPFINPVPKPVAPPAAAAAASPAAAVRPPGLKGVLVTEADIIGIVVSREPSMNVVTIQAPGGKRYFARVGDALFDAVVKSIKPDSVTFAVTGPGSREVVRKMRGEK
ncbi:MAG TPA: hypothetical protein VKY31_03510 [Terriglobia bacterium]|nr:hypothetical protein [Terriglobia bacterium]